MYSSQVQNVTSFFYSQAFADGLRATAAILMPAVIGSYTNHFESSIFISLGAMCTSFTDAPGPLRHKRNGMLACAICLFLVALITTLVNTNILLMGATIVVVCFLFSMLNVYGSRAGAVGNAAILVMILTMDRPIAANQVVIYPLLITTGALYYAVLSLLLYILQPYKISQRALGTSIRETASYLSLKADFYNPELPLPELYGKLLTQQINVHEKQDAVRELLFKSRQIVEESTMQGRRLVLSFVEIVDLFENVTATYYDYQELRNQYAETGILEKIERVLKQSATELDNIGIAIHAGNTFKSSFDHDARLRQLKVEIDSINVQGIPTRVLKRILVNIRRIFVNTQAIANYLKSEDLPASNVDHGRFVSRQDFSSKMFFDNLTFHSSIFRHSLRVTIACIVGFWVVKSLASGHHSYWILLTIAFILKPAYSLTKKRNIQRIWGTIAGAAIAVIIFIVVPSKTAQFVLMVLFMLGTYSFMRINYLAMVMFTTPYVLLLFQFLGLGLLQVAEERVLDTIIGCVIAFSAGHFLFPKWEAQELQQHMSKMLQANLDYLTKVIDVLKGRNLSMTEYKLVRKEVYVASANLAAAFQRMISEPKSKQASKREVYQFVVQNHVFFSNIASVATTLLHQTPVQHSQEALVLAKKAGNRLRRTLGIDKKDMSPDQYVSNELQPHSSAEEKSLIEHLEFIGKLSSDIEKTTEKIKAKTIE